MYEDESRAPKLIVTLIIATIILVLSLAGLGFWSWYNIGQANKQLSEANSRVSELQAEKTRLESDSTSEDEKSSNSNSPNVSNDEEMIKTAVKLRGRALASPSSSLQVSIAKKEGNLASVAVSSSQEGPGWGELYKKVDGQWVFIWSGQQGPFKEEADKWGLPKGWYIEQ